MRSVRELLAIGIWLLCATCCQSFATSSLDFQGCRSSVQLASSSSYLDNLSNVALQKQTTEATSFATPATTTTTTIPVTTTVAEVSNNFEYIPILSLHHADTIANSVISVCLRNGFNPITVHVLDHAGHVLVSKRMDGCSAVGLPEFSKAKAYSCIVNKYPSRAFRDRYTLDATDLGKFGQMLGMVAIGQGQMAPFPGGILVKLGDAIVGAVGVSGAAGDEDEYCAIRGVLESEFGLATVPAQHACSTVKDKL